VFNKSLTIVLPVHNAESRLRKNVRELLELASELTAKFGVLIIDDGSTDSTLEVAEELASYFPQVSVRRHRQCLGLGASIEYAQRRVRSDAIIVHDGVTPINSQQVRRLWRQWLDKSHSLGSTPSTAAKPANDAIDIANLQTLHASMEHVHRPVAGFQLMSDLQTGASPNSAPVYTTEGACNHASHVRKQAGVGQIPSLPRPKFLAALAEFALGE
jgi:glycosyltransferase involved in cell wall biosynthesis